MQHTFKTYLIEEMTGETEQEEPIHLPSAAKKILPRVRTFLRAGYLLGDDPDQSGFNAINTLEIIDLLDYTKRYAIDRMGPDTAKYGNKTVDVRDWEGGHQMYRNDAEKGHAGFWISFTKGLEEAVKQYYGKKIRDPQASGGSRIKLGAMVRKYIDYIGSEMSTDFAKAGPQETLANLQSTNPAENYIDIIINYILKDDDVHAEHDDDVKVARNVITGYLKALRTKQRTQSLSDQQRILLIKRAVQNVQGDRFGDGY